MKSYVVLLLVVCKGVSTSATSHIKLHIYYTALGGPAAQYQIPGPDI